MTTAHPKNRNFIMLLSWLLPGAGFFLNGRKARGLFFFVTLQLTFIVGAFLRGSVLVPDFMPGTPNFNVVAILTFITQIFNGGLGIISMMPELGMPALLPFDETNQWSDLGAFYLLVSGGMNYFVLMATYDTFYGKPQSRAVNRRRPATEVAQ